MPEHPTALCHQQKQCWVKRCVTIKVCLAIPLSVITEFVNHNLYLDMANKMYCIISRYLIFTGAFCVFHVYSYISIRFNVNNMSELNVHSVMGGGGLGVVVGDRLGHLWTVSRCHIIFLIVIVNHRNESPTKVDSVRHILIPKPSPTINL